MLIAITRSRYRFFFIQLIQDPPNPPRDPRTPPGPKSALFAPPPVSGGAQKVRFYPPPQVEKFFYCYSTVIFGGSKHPNFDGKMTVIFHFFRFRIPAAKMKFQLFFFFPFLGVVPPPKKGKKKIAGIYFCTLTTPPS